MYHKSCTSSYKTRCRIKCQTTKMGENITLLNDLHLLRVGSVSNPIQCTDGVNKSEFMKHCAFGSVCEEGDQSSFLSTGTSTSFLRRDDTFQLCLKTGKSSLVKSHHTSVIIPPPPPHTHTHTHMPVCMHTHKCTHT